MLSIFAPHVAAALAAIPSPTPPAVATVAAETASASTPLDVAPVTTDVDEKKPALTLEERVSELEAKLAAAQGQDLYKVQFKDGMRFESPDGQHQVRIGGRIHADWGWFSGDDASYDLEDGTEFRRARLMIDGLLWKNVEFRAQYDFAQGVTAFRDVYMGLPDTAIGGVRVGQFKEPFSLEEMTSANVITFMERGLPAAFVPSRNTGLMVYDHAGDTFTWAAGVFRPTDDDGDGDGDGEYNVTARITGLPMYEDEGKSLIHLGLGASLQSDDNGVISYSSRPEQHLVSNVATTGATAADGALLGGLEAAWLNGPLSVQGEYILSDVEADTGSDPTFSGWYVFVSYVLTGERRSYRTADGAFGAIKPEHNYGADGSGAWEVAARYSMLDLDDGASSDELADATLGLNWYLNPNTRVMLNYIHSEFEDATADDSADLLGMRFQITF